MKILFAKIFYLKYVMMNNNSAFIFVKLQFNSNNKYLQILNISHIVCLSRIRNYNNIEKLGVVINTLYNLRNSYIRSTSNINSHTRLMKKRNMK